VTARTTRNQPAAAHLAREVRAQSTRGGGEQDQGACRASADAKEQPTRRDAYLHRPPDHNDVMVRGSHNDASSEAGIAEILILILVALAIVALTIWIVQQFT
jgi:hypothetical protein